MYGNFKFDYLHYNRKMKVPLFTAEYPPNSPKFKSLVMKDINIAFEEDIGSKFLKNNSSGDLTAQLIPAMQIATATIITREKAVICGIPWATQAFKQMDNNILINWYVTEGDVVKPNQLLCEIKGNARALLSAERTALNFLQLLSSVATETRQYVDVIQHTKALILDTRKTIPGLRLAQKYAVSIGGGHNQRLALYDGILIKENHIAAAGSIQSAFQFAKNLTYHTLNKKITIQIEVETLGQLSEALTAGAQSVLLDNFDLGMLAEAVKLNHGRALLEASGGVSLNTVKAIAETGVDRISIGSITKNIHAIDLSLRIISTDLN